MNASPRAALDPDTARLLEQLARAPRKPVDEWTPIERRAVFRLAALNAPAPQTGAIVVNDATVATAAAVIPVRTYRPAALSDGPQACLLFLHGGGWVYGDLDTHDGLCRLLAETVGAVVLAVDYRLAPEHPHPAGLHDALEVIRRLHEDPQPWNVDPARIAVCGDSAGGNLAALLAFLTRDAGLPLAGQALFYPATDLRCGHPSHEACGRDFYLTSEMIHWCMDQYVPPAARGRPDVSPLLREDLSGVAPAFLAVGDCDPLRDEGIAYAEKLAAAGVPVTLEVAPGLIHGFASMTAVIPAARRPVANAASFLRDLLQPALTAAAP